MAAPSVVPVAMPSGYRPWRKGMSPRGSRPPRSGRVHGGRVRRTVDQEGRFPRALAREPTPIRANVVSPGVVRTELWRDLPEADREGLFASAAQSLPVGRVGEPEDVAEAYLYLMRGRFSTGSTVVVDGGTVLVRPRGVPCPTPRLSPR